MLRVGTCYGPTWTGVSRIRSVSATLVFFLTVPLASAALSSTSPATADVSFFNQVIPALTKLGCNSGSCHGKAEGQNGFKLSVFGFDPEADYEALVKQSRGRRVNRVVPAASLMLRKATGAVPHGGGQRTEKSSIHYQTVLQWLTEGAPFDAEPVAVARIEVEPSEIVLPLTGAQQLQVTAHFSDGEVRDVTGTAEFQSNSETVAIVSSDGRVSAKGVPGEAAVLVRFLHHLAVCRVTMPRTDTQFQRPVENNFIDKLVWDKLERLGVQPSELSDDSTFLRRVYLDTIGTLPTSNEAREFLARSEPDKRSLLIQELLQRHEYSVYQSLKWADLLRLDSNALGAESSVAFTRWLRIQFQQNRPYDKFVRDILAASGSIQAESPAALYTTLKEPKELGSSISQLFLGIRIECAECHHHPFEKWSQDDFYAFAGLFTSVGTKTLPNGVPAITVKPGADLRNPRTNLPVVAKGLGQDPPEPHNADVTTDRRLRLADWMTSEANPYFARAIVNRIWSAYFARGLVDPVDDLRATNPASHEALHEALADYLIRSHYDLKLLTRLILESRTYQLSPIQNGSNADDQQHFSRAEFRPVPAEVLLDAICQTTAIPEKFNGWPLGARAIEVWDNRMPSYFFRIFGRPTRTTVCACERGDAPSISQALHLLNSPEISEKLQHRHGRVRQLARSDLSPEQIVEELYLTTLSRFPTDEESLLMTAAFQKSEDRVEVVEDLMWTLLNTKEFLFNH